MRASWAVWINPLIVGGDLVEADLQELQPLLATALTAETNEDNLSEMVVTARGLSKAAEILAGEFSLVATNVPYLGRGKQGGILRRYLGRVYPDAKPDLATCFIHRSLDLCKRSGAAAFVTSQNWWFSTGYTRFRRHFLGAWTTSVAASLGEEAWQAFGDRGPMAALMVVVKTTPSNTDVFWGIDAKPLPTIDQKVVELESGTLRALPQLEQLRNPDSRIVLDPSEGQSRLLKYAVSVEGMSTGDADRYVRLFWELPELSAAWEPFQQSPDGSSEFSGARAVVRWELGEGDLARSDGARVQGHGAWGRRGVVVNMMRHLNVALTVGAKHDKITAIIVPAVEAHLLPIWTFCSSRRFFDEVRKLSPGVQPGTGTLVKVPFDLEHWQGVAAATYPAGLPTPQSLDPTQWLFGGNPELSTQPLHVAVGRLLGYRWPRQTGTTFPGCAAVGPDAIDTLADVDGIACLSAINKEQPAAACLRTLLASALGSFDEQSLVGAAGPNGSKSKTLEAWLRDEFFDQHVKVFENRPFIWHVWDGRLDGFNALVNYHSLDNAALQKLTYSYLGDWIRQQERDAKNDVAGAADRLGAALKLQGELAKILEGEPPYDIFVRWKPLSGQPLGWHPDLNDGVAVNIRPFLLAQSPGKKGTGLLRSKVRPMKDKDRGNEPPREKGEYPWFWSESAPPTDFAGGRTFKGRR